MSVVVDASAVVAGLLDDGTVGRWVRAASSRDDVVAPHLMPFEATDIPRRAIARGDVSDDIGCLAHRDLLDLPVILVDYPALATRAWELRGAVSVYDAASVALAEAYGVPLMTLDLRLAAANGPRCRILTPPDDAD
ncbi:type II toxin-antitoxin system VapC family toxin [Actinomycetospora sp. CA-084318]|uniref:type II toxin-antitoxin system VapC family toxin n=1 Tax=Actinomycetospora sp. CA-084318 TaxID=3239892 RepID=UPI003D988056